MSVFGPLRALWWPETAYSERDGGCDITGRLQPRSRELLALLAVHPEGMTREAMVDALWGPNCPRRPVNALTTSISRLCATVAAATEGTISQIVTADSRRFRLAPQVVTDYEEFAQAKRERGCACSDAERATAYRNIIDTAARGELAAGLNTDWIEPIREAVRRDAISALGALAGHLIEHDPRRTAELLETALELDPHNDAIWRDVLRLHARLGEFGTIDRSLAVLTHKLAEIGEKPSREIRELADHLRRQAS